MVLLHLPAIGTVAINPREATTQRHDNGSDGFTNGDEMSVQPIGGIRAGRGRANTRGGGFDPAKRNDVIPAADAWAGGGGGRYCVVALTIKFRPAVHVSCSFNTSEDEPTGAVYVGKEIRRYGKPKAGKGRANV